MVDAHSPTNRVVVYLSRDTEGAQAKLRMLYGASVITDRGAPGFPDCANRGDCRNPMKGGLRIDAGSGYSGQCTSAFQAKKANGDRVLITAGHCLDDNGDAGTAWLHDSNQFGVSQGNSIDLAANDEADIGWIKIDSSEDVAPADRVYGSSNTDIKNIHGVMPNSLQDVGDTVCRSGEQTGWDCEIIKNDDASKPNGSGQDIDSVWVWSHDSEGGDSGGAMLMQFWVGGTAYWYAAGLHVHSTPDNCPEAEGPDTCRSWYSTAEQVETEADAGADLTICLTTDCS